MRTAILLTAATLVSAAPNRARVGAVDVQLRFAPGPVAVLTFQLQPGWHLYWKDPGDSGLPPEVRWTLPEGWEAGPLEHPVPAVFQDAAGAAYGHAGQFHLVARLRGAGFPSGAFRAEVEWLACKEGCVPGRATLTANPAAASHWLSRGPAQAVLASLPGPPGPELRLGPPRLVRGPGRWSLEVPLQGPAASQAVRFFPETPEGFSILHAEVRVSGGWLQVPLVPGSALAALPPVKGILLLGKRGVALTLPVPTPEVP